MATSVYLTNPFGGGGGTPGGSDTQIQYNNAGAFGGVTGFTWSGTALAIPGPATLTGAVGSSALTITGGTQTASFPALSLTQTWNNAGVTFTGVLVNVTNTASNASSLLLDLQVGGVSQVSITRGAVMNITSVNGLATGYGYLGGIGIGYNAAKNLTIPSDGLINFGSSGLNSPDVYLYRDAAAVLAQRNGINAQTFRCYGTFTDSSNYERLAAITAAGDYSLTPQAGGTGTLRGLQVVASGGRVGFFGTTAIARVTTGVTAATFAANTSGIANDTATFNGYTLGQVVAALQNYGLLT